MRGILADINSGKRLRAILAVWHSDVWRDLWYSLDLSVESFPALGLPFESSDAILWRTCQREGLVLVTANSNADDPDSLESVIRRENQPDSLPIITFANPDRVIDLSEFGRSQRDREQLPGRSGIERGKPRRGTQRLRPEQRVAGRDGAWS
jgi:hypothetical protein